MIERKFTKGDTLVPLYATLQDGAGQAVDLTDQTVLFYMKNAETGALKVNGVAASILDIGAGEVLYAWRTADVDTIGKFWGWFVRVSAAQTGTHPIGKQLRIEFVEGPV